MDGRAEGRPGRPAIDEPLRDLALLRAAVEGGLDGMVVVSSDGVMITYNRKFQEIWPIPAEIVASGDDDAALASVLDKLVDPDAFLARVHDLYAQASGAARDELLLLDGRVLDRYGTGLRGPDGDYIGWAWYFRDVTAERAAAVDAERLGALVAVAHALADARSELDVLSVVSGRGASVLGAQGAAMCLVEPDGAHVRVLGTTFFDEQLRADVAVLPVDAPLPLVHAALTGKPLFLGDRAEGLRQFPGALEVYVRARTEATAAVPLTVHGRTIGSLAVAFEDRKPWRVSDKVLLTALAALTALALDRLAAQAAEREATRQIRRLSGSLQRSLLTALPQSDRMQIAARYQPAAREAEVGGDWYDAFSTRDGTMTLVVGDVAGHDSTAAAAMAQVRNVLRGVAQTLQASPAAVLAALDGALARLRMTTLATAVLCQAWPSDDDPSGRTLRLRWSNAGHPPPLLLHTDGRCELLAGAPEVLLGAHVEGRRTDREVDMPPGTALVLYTDGLVERRDQLLDDGIEQLRQAVEELHGLPPERLCEELLARLTGGDSEDDVVLLVARIAG
ncbi:SpoIIE family protein phosphatase [Blastococcus capsensis]|uniref:SpoIIE family protein phosphatase n=1 Tax=Blastococcus capsensis TaxID=1564163 RepID=UPI002541C8F6|nr:SpoIIE family protein phosphatase [Blastococcus capsensis]MDK3258046.1 SpoIIE family protein phosphatase [Blastococcus capsensis]MDK3258061.1 SpoIIE family protein phosphatase [Blastococcus capsensis]